MRTTEEIAEQIAYLRAIKPPAALNAMVARRIALVIRELEAPGQYFGWEKPGDWPVVAATRRWLFNETNSKPADYWSEEKS